MAKLTTTALTQLSTNEVSAVSTINANFALVETAIENTLSRDGTTPNTMSADLDLNSNDLLNANAISSSLDFNGNGSPEGVVTAVVGAIYRRLDGGANTTLYVKESGTGNTGWVAK